MSESDNTPVYQTRELDGCVKCWTCGNAVWRGKPVYVNGDWVFPEHRHRTGIICLATGKPVSDAYFDHKTYLQPVMLAEIGKVEARQMRELLRNNSPPTGGPETHDEMAFWDCCIFAMLKASAAMNSDEMREAANRLVVERRNVLLGVNKP